MDPKFDTVVRYIKSTPFSPPFNTWRYDERSILSSLAETAELEFLGALPRSITGPDTFRFEVFSRIRQASEEDVTYLFIRWSKLFTKNSFKIIDGFLKATIAERDKHKCCYCNQFLQNDFNVHHVLPKIRRGTDSIFNLVLTCEPCNKKISSQIILPLNWWELHPESRHKVIQEAN